MMSLYASKEPVEMYTKETDEEMYGLARAHMEKFSAAASLDRRLWDAVVRLMEWRQAKIDALMLEHCPDEMTTEQIDNWSSHQRAASPEESAVLDRTAGVIRRRSKVAT